MNLVTLTELTKERLDKVFTYYLKDNAVPASQLQEAMAYAVLNGGKRLRPLLIYATGYALDASHESLDIPACAIEFIHAYSLIHDDLPSMDNADLRRGKPSCHKAYNEGLAILAGDALQPLAFELITSHPANLSASQRLEMIKILSNASGYQGMAAGQTLDIEGTDLLEEMYNLKTGALLIASVQLAAVAAGVQNADIFHALETYAKNIGLAFQIQDDLLDLESSELTGKTQGLDIQNNKPTFPSLYGVEKAYAKIEELFSQALLSLNTLGPKTAPLKELAHHLMQRKY